MWGRKHTQPQPLYDYGFDSLLSFPLSLPVSWSFCLLKLQHAYKRISPAILTLYLHHWQRSRRPWSWGCPGAAWWFCQSQWSCLCVLGGFSPTGQCRAHLFKKRKQRANQVPAKIPEEAGKVNGDEGILNSEGTVFHWWWCCMRKT